MATNGYIRQSTADIQAGLEIKSLSHNNEYDALQTAFDNTIGHDHSGSAAGVGAPIPLGTAVTGVLPAANGGTGLSSGGTSTTVLHGGVSPAFGKVSLTADISGTLAIANGGIGSTSYGPIDGTSSAKTTNYTLVNADKRKTISLGGSALYTFTVSAASGYDSDFQARIYNADTTQGKFIAINGYSTYILWPLQHIEIQNISNSWKVYPNTPERWRAPQGTSFYVDNGGSDTTGDGLSVATAFSTIAKAWSTIQDKTDYHSPIITFTNGMTYDIGSGIELDGDNTTSGGRLIQLLGDPTLVNPPIFDSAAGSAGLLFRDMAWAQVDGIRFTTRGNASVGVAVQQFALADIFNCQWGQFPSGVQIAISDNGRGNVTLNQAIFQNGGSIAFLTLTSHSSCTVTATFTGNGATYAFSNGFFLLDITSSVVLSGTTFSNVFGFSGPQYALTNGSFLSKGGVTIPGSAGTADALSKAY